MTSPYDLVGCVLPQALRLARYQALPTLPENVQDLTSENDTLNQSPSREEERLLASNASVMTALENIFSWREKDRTCRTSRLSRIESVRFQRAMYRFWLMSVLYGPRRFSPRRWFSGDGNDEEDDRMSILEKTWKDQKAFLEQFSSQEIFQIRKLVQFVNMTAHWALTAEGRGMGGTLYTYDWDGMFLFAGPHIILRCYEDEVTTYLPTQYIDDDGPYEKFFTHPFSEIVKERKVTPPISYVGVILDDIHGEHDRCRHCGGAGLRGSIVPNERLLPELYNETNWDDLKGWLDWEFLIARNLTYNQNEKPLQRRLNGDWSRLIVDLFPCRSNEYAQWSKEDWICSNCWSSFFWDTMWRWRLAQKKKAGEQIKPDCRRGYHCEEQCFDRGLAHADQFNHLCEPVMDSPVVQVLGSPPSQETKGQKNKKKGGGANKKA